MYESPMNPYYGNVNALINAGYMARNYQGENQQVVEALSAGISRETSAIDLYSRLADAAPDQNHRYSNLQAMENKKVHLKQFTDLYIMLTGRQPEYQIDKVSFDSYHDGLQKAYQAEIKSHEEYRKSCWIAQHPLIRNVFWRACAGENVKAARWGFFNKKAPYRIKDYGGEPFVVNIKKVTTQNNTYRTALWTGDHLQVTLMSINVGDDIGLEVHPTTDQFLRIEQGQGLVQMGDTKNNLDFEQMAYADYAIMIPAGKWHNVTNTGKTPMKVYAIYAPPEHPFGTVHKTKSDAMAAEESY